jgi:hypothetical protein
MSNGNIQNKPPVLPEACDLPKTKLEFKDAGPFSSKYNLLQTTKVMSQVATNWQNQQNTSTAASLNKPLDNPVKIDKIEVKKNQ